VNDTTILVVDDEPQSVGSCALLFRHSLGRGDARETEIKYRGAIQQESVRDALVTGALALRECWSECRLSTEFDQCGFYSG
jgi:hypothetical protein